MLKRFKRLLGRTEVGPNIPDLGRKSDDAIARALSGELPLRHLQNPVGNGSTLFVEPIPGHRVIMENTRPGKSANQEQSLSTLCIFLEGIGIDPGKVINAYGNKDLFLVAQAVGILRRILSESTPVEVRSIFDMKGKIDDSGDF